MKIITPLVLFGLGVVLLVLAVVLYPSAAAEVPGPPVPILALSSHVPMETITYDVVPASSGRTNVDITVSRNPLAPRSRSRAASVRMFTVPGHGVTRNVTFGHSRSAVATAHFTIDAADFGMMFNDISASAAIPEIYYTGPGTPSVVVSYSIPSASSYDWSPFPNVLVSSSHAIWTIATTRSDIPGQALASTQGQVAVGINHAREATDSNKTFAAGALLGLAGGAILSAVQEALHARD